MVNIKRKSILSFCILLIILAIPLIFLAGCNQSDNLFEFGLKTDGSYSIKELRDKNVTSVEIPTTYNGKPIKHIDRSAFEGCENLTSVIIPEGIEIIDNYAFKDCSKLESISLPDSIIEIDSSAFDNCSSLQYNIYENGNYLGNTNNPYVVLMKGIDNSVASYKVNESCNVIYENALSGFSKLTNIDMPYSITYIGSNAFSLCSSLESFTIPNFVKYFDASWFYYCTNLQSITLSANIEMVSIGYMYGCDSFSEFDVYSTNAKFSARDGVLYTKDLKTLLAYPIAKEGNNFDIPSYVETIATYAFNGCKYLKALTMWSSIDKLLSSSVINCDFLHTLYFKGTMSEWIKLDNANLGWDHSFAITKVICSDGVLNRGKA